jgi:hypothetical protein
MAASQQGQMTVQLFVSATAFLLSDLRAPSTTRARVGAEYNIARDVREACVQKEKAPKRRRNVTEN